MIVVAPFRVQITIVSKPRPAFEGTNTKPAGSRLRAISVSTISGPSSLQAGNSQLSPKDFVHTLKLELQLAHLDLVKPVQSVD